MNKQELLRKLPKVDEVLKDQRLFVFMGETSRDVIVEAIREAISSLRTKLLNEEENISHITNYDDLMDNIIALLVEKNQKSLRRTINATGVTLHTNLGRAKLSKSACESVMDIASSFSTLEYDVKKGARGSRHDHVEKLIIKITGAEAAMVVNNNAAATMLCLSSMAFGKEVIVSRGELVEIGGSFRIPEIMEQSGAILREVGTTNKTKAQDYKRAVNIEATGALLKVHTSNYRIVGFTEEASLEELVALGREVSLPVIYDMGSGLMINLEKYGVEEPTVIDALKTGIDVILFSGDKLLGGPQGGIIAGKKKYIDAMKKHPLARILRVDKMTLAAMEATFREYLDMEKAIKEIPVLEMLTRTSEELYNNGLAMKEAITEKTAFYNIAITEVEERVGGGSAPTSVLRGYALAIDSISIAAEKIERALRSYKIPIITRIYKNKVYIDMRTITQEERLIIIEALKEISEKYSMEKKNA
ncbi:L-seryl-tRNA(Sec) selenium transferase [Alloiococcus sp. CFN-8]|uniref:L-seryl-tRNA(Sec) selenium transferase n=1 Tax=Alloiococcus sp. CFN-8 TaxID=3416081 RepID=UPI003CFABC4A